MDQREPTTTMLFGGIQLTLLAVVFLLLSGTTGGASGEHADVLVGTGLLCAMVGTVLVGSGLYR